MGPPPPLPKRMFKKYVNEIEINFEIKLLNPPRFLICVHLHIVK
jgi:hypothetical protein